MPYIEEGLPFTGNAITTEDRSRAAAEQAAGKAGSKRHTVLMLICSHLKGLTDKEMQKLLGWDGSTQRPRRIELWRAHLIEEGGSRVIDGRECTVWVSTLLGRMV